MSTPAKARRPAAVAIPAVQRARGGEMLALGLVLLAGAALRTAYFQALLGWPYWRELILGGDGHVYYRAAQEILAGSPWGIRVSFQDPLYALFVAGVMKLTVMSPAAPLVAQSILGLLSALLAWALARRMAGPVAGVAAAALVALSPVAVFYDGLLEKSPLCMFLFTLGAWLLASGVAEGRKGRVAGAGAALAAAVLLRGNVLLVLPLALAVPLLARPRGVRAGAAIALLLAGIMLVFGATALRNRAVFGDWTITPGQSGPNFFIGNNPENQTGTFMPQPWLRDDLRFEEMDWRAEAERRTGRLMSRSSTSAFWLGEGLTYWRDSPAAAFKNLVRKGLLYFSEFEQPDTHPYLFFRPRFAPLRLPLPGMGPIAALSVLGLVLSIPLWRARSAELLLFLGHAGSVIVFFILGRYRIVALPLFAVFAGVGLGGLVHLVRRRAFVKLAAALILILLAVLVTKRGRYPEVYEWPLFNVSITLIEEGRFEEAEALVAEGLAAHPDSALGLEVRGGMAIEAGDLETAESALEAAAEWAPERRSLKLALARLRARQGREAEASRMLEEMLREAPFDGELRRERDRLRALRGTDALPPPRNGSPAAR
ncbi:MAG: tetratricopeptide repeat protein [Deltaproteobacteria bacterium]|nr:tetratricopeptide repeat protein [Deltaproteobacteria bacterium]